MKQFLKIFLQTFNPNVYSGLSSRRHLNTISFVLILIFLFSTIKFILFLPQLIHFYNSFDDNLAKINFINLSLSVNTSSPVDILKKPKIIIDSSRNSTNDEFILITKNIVYKKGFFNYKEFVLNGQNLVTFLKEKKSNIFLVLAFFVPTVFLLYYIVSLIKFVLFVFIVFTFGLIFVKLMDYRIRTRKIVVSAIYALTIPILLSLIPEDFFLKALVPLLAYFIWYVLILVLLSDSKIEFKKQEKVINRKKIN